MVRSYIFWWKSILTDSIFTPQCDGVQLDLKNGPSLQGIAVLNIPSIYGGSNLWGDNTKKQRKQHKKAAPAKKKSQSTASHFSTSGSASHHHHHRSPGTSCTSGRHCLKCCIWIHQTYFGFLLVFPANCNSSSYGGSASSINIDLANAVQDIGDKYIEVIGLENCMHMGQVKAGLRASGRRLAQCSNVVIR